MLTEASNKWATTNPTCPICKRLYLLHGHNIDCNWEAERDELLQKLATTVNGAGIKNDQDKPRMELLDAVALEQLAAVLTFGAAKYAPNNWRKGISSSRLLAAALRHIFSYLKGEKLDSESNLPHLAHAMCCLMFALNLAETRPELTDHVQQARRTEEGGVLPIQQEIDPND